MAKISVSVLDKHDIETILKLNDTDITYLHIDVMDGKFVKNSSFKPEEIIELNKITNKKLDVHLMVLDIEKYLEALSGLNIEYLTFHYEILNNLTLIDKVRSYGFKCGLAIKPETDIRALIPILNRIDMILLMSVEPGMGGQPFMDNTIKKIEYLKHEIRSRGFDTIISVDGGINNSNATLCLAKGADMLVVGSYITKSNNFQDAINKLTS
ncbi:MAG: ribulose-phosphate 3-epimerase [Bacilli bacterium]|nr:ribulose-phosphate 3-epimerase [Bacilli bacterium]